MSLTIFFENVPHILEFKLSVKIVNNMQCPISAEAMTLIGWAPTGLVSLSDTILRQKITD